MNRNLYRRRKHKPRVMMIKETIDKTMKVFHKTFRNLKSFLIHGYHKLPKTTSSNPIFSVNNSMMSYSKLKNEDFLYQPKEQAKGDDHFSNESSMKAGDESGRFEELEEEKKINEYCQAKREDSITLAENMREIIEMMDLNNMDHMLDIQEVLHYYSQLTCPVYRKMVDKFFMSMHYELFNNIPQTSTSVHSSMRRLGPIKV